MNRRELLQAALAAPVASLVPSCLIAPASTTLVLKSAAGDPIMTATEVLRRQVGSGIWLWPQTVAELESGRWPYNPAYPPGHVLRYT